MGPEALARLHARAFARQGRGWSAAEFADLLASPHCCLCVEPNGFALTRVIAGEAELLTLATDPDYRRQGVAARLLHNIEAAGARRGAQRQFLEVAADNAAARALYAAAGYRQTGRRAGYYSRSDGPPVDALLLTKDLEPCRD
ncbi:GNAT family N-acetyltransferase [Roseovarius sp. Pro17]|uniref:GNAT family N-acetyltransferase n=1 Tax=Roseovarius sp. Pro17 TaxID=3108175 RepID=UPI002D7795C8|nr:GNAT family N-acetyltransferase [Roseovarius sp. Pro17]